jgi:DNA (cytosine-5)-methyltransferase 1
MKHGSLFSGIGGFDLAAEWMGWENVFHCEWNEFGQRVLHHYWPQAIQYNDITKTDFTIHRGAIDILTGGFPCQPYSAAGKRLGKEDERHLWPEMLRAIREIQPRWVVGENVRGLTNWNGGLVFDEVQSDLEALGYEVLPFLLPACAKDAPHRRDRIWFVAYREVNPTNGKPVQTSSVYDAQRPQPGSELSLTPHAKGNGGDRTPTQASEKAWRQNGKSVKQFEQRSEVRTFTHSASDGLHDESTESNNTVGANNKQPRLQRLSPVKGFSHEQPTSYSARSSSAGQHEQRPKSRQLGGLNSASIVADTNSRRQPGKKYGQAQPGRTAKTSVRGDWQNFPTVSPLRQRDDGVSNKLLRFVVNEFYGTGSHASKKNRIKNLQEVRERILQEEVWEAIRGLYSLESKAVLLQVVQLYSESYEQQVELSPFGSKLCEPVLRTLSKHGEFRRTPQGQELQKQREKQFADTLSFLPHEVALAARRFETAVAKFETWHRNESIKAYGNAVVPQVVYEIFKAIEAYQDGRGL